MQNISRRERIMVLAMVVVVLAALLLKLMPGGAAGPSGKLLPKDKADQQYRKDRDQYIKLGQQQDELEPRLAKMAYEDSAATLIPHVVRDLQVIAQQSGVHLREVRPLRARALKSGQGMRVPLDVHFRAAFQPDVVRFLYHVEDPAGRMVMDKLDVTGAEARFKTVDVSVVISVFTKSLTDEANMGEGDASDGTQANGQG